MKQKEKPVVKVKKGVTLLLVGAFFINSMKLTALAGVNETEKKLNQAKEEQKKTEEAIQSAQEEIEELQGDADSLKNKLNSLNKDLSEVSDNLSMLESRIADKEVDISVAAEELDLIVRAEEEQYAAMKKRIQFMYEKKDSSLMSTYFGGNSFSEILNQNHYFERLTEYDREQLTKYQEIRLQVEEKKAQLEREREELDDLLEQTEAEKNRVSGLINHTSGEIAGMENAISKAEEEMLAYERKLEEQKSSIAQLQKQLEEERRLSALAAKSSWRNISDISFAEGDRYLLANIIYCEAGNQPYEGQLAVGAVVMNRVMSSVCPDTVVGVIYQKNQFSPVKSGRLALALANGSATASCYQAADEAMAGRTNVGNCLFFRRVTPGINGTVIGDHVFY